MITADVQLTQYFSRGVAGLVYGAGLDARVVVPKEISELIKTLVRLSPKAQPAKIRSDVIKRFTVFGREGRDFIQGKDTFQGHGEVAWYFASSHQLSGVKKEADLRAASVADLKALMYQRTRAGAIRGRRGRQMVYISQKILTKASTVAKLAAAKVRNRGRLAAGWLVSVVKGPIKITGGRIPEFVNRHAQGARGSYIDGITGKFPRFTIINTAVGIGQKSVDGIVKSAVKIRAKAMQANALLFMKGKKNISDYAR